MCVCVTVLCSDPLPTLTTMIDNINNTTLDHPTPDILRGNPCDPPLPPPVYPLSPI